MISIEDINFSFSNISKNLKRRHYDEEDLINVHRKFLKDFQSNELDCISIVKNRSKIKAIDSKLSIFCDCKDIIIVGTGGSTLGSKMIDSIFSGKKKIHYVENVDPSSIEKLLTTLNHEVTGLIVISKSGETIETLSQFFFLLNHFKKENKLIRQRTLVITEKKKSTLKLIQEKLNLEFAEHDKNIGGRYSVFSIVGLLPVKLNDIKIENILNGGEKVLNKLLNLDNPNNFAPTKSSLIHAQLLKNNFNMNVLFTYLDSLQNFSLWFRQLWAESIGKNGHGSTPINAVGTVDQHSQLQLYLDGPKDKFFTIIGMEKPLKSNKLNCHINKINLSESLHKKTLGDLLFAEMKATYQTIKNKNIPLRLIKLNKIDEETLGSLIMCFFIETIYTCYLLKINPFDQPAVEEGKKLAIKFLNNEN